jgi:hypothetical protein
MSNSVQRASVDEEAHLRVDVRWGLADHLPTPLTGWRMDVLHTPARTWSHIKPTTRPVAEYGTAPTCLCSASYAQPAVGPGQSGSWSGGNGRRYHAETDLPVVDRVPSPASAFVFMPPQLRFTVSNQQQHLCRRMRAHCSCVHCNIHIMSLPLGSTGKGLPASQNSLFFVRLQAHSSGRSLSRSIHTDSTCTALTSSPVPVLHRFADWNGCAGLRDQHACGK